MVQRVKRLPAMRDTWVLFLSQEDPLEKEMATHSGTLAWEIPWTEEPGGLQSTGSQREDTPEQLSEHSVVPGLPRWLSGRIHLPVLETWV